MDNGLIMLIVLISIYVVLLIAGILLKRYTRGRLDDIDGANGVHRKEDCKGTPIGAFGDERKK